MFDPEFTAEAFGGGACKVFYLVGYMKRKEELGITDAVLKKHTFKSGVSGGTIISALMAEGVTSDKIDEYFRKNENVMKNFFAIDLFGILHLHNGVDDENGYKIDSKERHVANSGFAHTANLEKFLRNFIGDVKFKERPNLEFTAVDWERKCPIYINYKTCPDLRVREGCIASSTLPGVFSVPRIKHDGKWKYTIDGGIIENLPIKKALENKKIKNIFAATFTGIFPEEKHPDAWWGFLAPSVTLCAAYNERMFMNKILGEDYLDFVTKKEVTKIKYKGRKINLVVTAPKNIDSYAFEPNYKNFQELFQKGYNDSKRIFEKFEELNKKRFFFFR